MDSAVAAAEAAVARAEDLTRGAAEILSPALAEVRDEMQSILDPLLDQVLDGLPKALLADISEEVEAAMALLDAELQENLNYFDPSGETVLDELDFAALHLRFGPPNRNAHSMIADAEPSLP